MLIILDRDGVINFDSPNYIKSPEEWCPIPGSLAAIAELNRAGHRVVVASNQSGIAKGLYDFSMLNAIHEKMTRQLDELGGHLDGIFICPHQTEDNCECRKPKPGLLIQIAEQFNVDLKDALLIGDSYRDIQAALAVNCPCFLVETGNGLAHVEQYPELKGIRKFVDLKAAVDFVLQPSSRG